jgi:hypothetical protein
VKPLFFRDKVNLLIKTISKNTYFYTLPSIPSHQGRGDKRETSHYFPLPLWERVRVRGIFGTNTISAITALGYLLGYA